MNKADPNAIKKLVQESGLSYRVGPQSFIFTCPRCNKNDKLYIRKTDGVFRCWSCVDTDRFGGAPEFAFKELLNLTLTEIKKILYGDKIADLSQDFDISFEQDPDSFSKPEPETVDRPYEHQVLSHKHAKKGLAYLEGRGISLEVAEFYDVQYSTIDRRVIFPVHYDNRLVGWQARTIEPTEFLVEGKIVKTQKILSTANFPKDRTVMFESTLLESEHVVLCEGPVDAIKCHLVGGNIATMGKGVETGQIERMLSVGPTKKRLYINTDPDAINQAEKLAERFGGDIQCFLVELPKGFKDIGEMSLEEAKDAVLSSKPLVYGNIYVYF